MRLDRLDTAPDLQALRGFPGNRLEALKGDRSGQYSIRINDPWRFWFAWPDSAPGPGDVEIVDDHTRQKEDLMARTAIHPGEHLAEELHELGMTAAELARQIAVPVNRITQIMSGKRAITADTALRLGHWFNTGPEVWLNLQQLYELRRARATIGAEIELLPKRGDTPPAGASGSGLEAHR